MNNRLRRIDATSLMVSTVAGSATAGADNGVGGLATFNYPSAIVIDRTTIYLGVLLTVGIRKIGMFLLSEF